MRKNFLKTGAIGSALLALAGCGSDPAPTEPTGQNIARADLVAADGTAHGEVIAGQAEDGLLIQIKATGLSPGPHGVHIHAVGQCEGPDFTSAGGHWNPTGKEHGFDNPAGAHMGDFFNLDVGEDGNGSLEAKVEGATLKGEQNALLDEDGAAFIVHAGPDDLKTDPSGDSGGRVACGVFEGK